MSLGTYCLLVFLILCALCWKWYDDEAKADDEAVRKDSDAGT
jgi:hypothetical protein